MTEQQLDGADNPSLNGRRGTLQRFWRPPMARAVNSNVRGPMYLLYCDETNFQKSSGDFFVYGGITIHSSKVKALSNEVDAIRKRLGVPREYLLKFNPGPTSFSHEQFIELKKEVIRALVAAEGKLFINLLLHDIAKSSEEARRFGINTLCYHFDCYLNRSKEPGLVLIDRFDDKKIDGHLKEKLQVGLSGSLPYSNEMKIEHITGYHLTAIGQSHFCSLVDVVLGSLRFSINAFTQNNIQHQNSAKEILEQLSPLFYREGSAKVHPISLWFSPKEIRHAGYRTRYVGLAAKLAEHGIEPAQVL